jgi:hypothetical protein
MTDPYLRMTSIPAMFGREVSYATDMDGKHVLRFAIRPAEDLVIDKEVEVEATYPGNFMTVAGQVVLRTRTPSVFFQTGVLEPVDGDGGPLAVIPIPWLDSATKYPITVWFYSARRALKRPTRSIWKTPIVVKHHFIESKRQYAMEGFISDVDPDDDTLMFSASGSMNVLKDGQRGADASVVPVVGATVAVAAAAAAVAAGRLKTAATPCAAASPRVRTRRTGSSPPPCATRACRWTQRARCARAAARAGRCCATTAARRCARR